MVRQSKGRENSFDYENTKQMYKLKRIKERNKSMSNFADIHKVDVANALPSFNEIEPKSRISPISIKVGLIGQSWQSK